MVTTVKFSDFATAPLTSGSNEVVGLESGVNVQSTRFLTWTTAGRPAAPFNGLFGLNTDSQLYEYWDAVDSLWVQFATTNILAILASHLPGDGASLIGLQNQSNVTNKFVQDLANASFIARTDNGTLQNGQFLGSLTTGIVKNTTVTGVLSISAPLTSIDGLTTAAHQFLITTASNVYATFGPLTDGQLIIGSTGLAPVIATLTQGSGVTITNGPGSIIISATGTGGTVTSLAAGTGITLTPSPITTTGSIALTIPVAVTSGGTGLISTTVNEILYSSSNNVIAGLATSVNATLITSAGGVPSLSQTLPTAVQGNIAQLGAQSQALNMNTHLINNVVDPISAQDAATKNYVDQTSLNGTSVYAASAATLGTVTQSGAGAGATLTNAGVQATFALDGVNPPAGTNVLIKNTATGMTAANEGIYTVTNVGSGATNWVLTRATSYDTPAEINTTGLIVVQNGSTLAGTAWYNATTIVTVDTTSFNYNQFGNIVFPVTLAQGGTSASLVASNGGIFYSTATAGAILAGTATARQMLQSGLSSAPAWSTSTWPATTTINQILFSSAANTVTGISSLAGGVLVTDASSVPQFLTNPAAAGKVLQSGNAAISTWSTPTYPSASGTSGTFIISNGTNNVYSTSTIPTSAGAVAGKVVMSDGTNYVLSATAFPTSAGATGTILRSDGTNWVATTSTYPNTNAVNTLLYASSANVMAALATANSGVLVTSAGGVPSISSTLPAFTTSSITFSPTTSGIVGTTTNDSASTGFVGEFVSSVIPAASAVSLSNNTAANITSISLTAGDWNVWGNIFFSPSIGMSNCIAWVSSTSATLPDNSLLNVINFGAAVAAGNGISAPTLRFSLSGTTTIYLSGRAGFVSGTVTGCGGLYARRVR